jgi:hypothetical protein
LNTNTIFCTSCGTANEAGARFCYKCGAQIKAVPATSGAVPPALPNSSDFITLSCPNCGGKLQVTAEMDRFACPYCGHEHIVRRAGGTVSLEPVLTKLNQISADINGMGGGISHMTAVAEKQAAEAAIKRLKEEIEELHKRLALLENNATTIWLIFGIGAVVLAMSIFVLWLDHGETGILKAIFYPGAFIGGLLTVAGLISVITVSQSRAKEEKQIYAKIQQKEQEINRNHQIVNS